MRSRRQLIMVGASLVCCVLRAFEANAAFRDAASCSNADVLAAYNAASAGDTINVPAGNCTWSSTISLSKPISVIGAGSSLTRLTASSGLQSGFFYAGFTSSSLVRVSGFYFDLVSNNSAHNYGVDLGGSLSSVRIDNNRFNYGKYALNVDGRVFGVIDHNYFYNNDAAVQFLGGTGAQNNQSWADPIVAGMNMGLSTLYLEDNQFVRDSALSAQTNFFVESGHGGRFVIRYNMFDCHLYRTDANFSCYPIMMHGNGNYYSGTSNDLRGHPIVEIYNNTIRAYRVDDAIIMRGGSVLIHDNIISYQCCTNSAISLREEESVGDGSPAFSPSRSVWPAEDQIFNSFIWNNTSCLGYPCTGAPNNDANVMSGSGTFIQKDRDFFTHAPASSGGSETFTGRAGASNTYPTNSGSATMVFSSSGQNAYYPYTPFTYPHPLTAGTPPSVPTSVHIVP